VIGLTAAQPGLRVLQRNLWVYRRTWRGSIFTSFLTPVLFLLAMGMGLGALVNQGAGAAGFGGVTYLAFLAPGLMAGGAMQTAAFESSFPIMARIQWRRNYEAMLATPLGVRDLLVGELGYIGFRLLTTAGVFFLVMLAFGVVRSPLAPLSVPVAVLTGYAFSPLIVAFSATQKGDTTGFNMLFRFVIMPLYLFSGSFFPIEQLPGALQALAWLTPLYNGVALTRGLVLGTAEPLTAVAHTAVLVAYAGVGLALARRNLGRRMVG
jgi:lipooligosaccharide transport system permease protein